jgi:hypothetical protein
MNNSSELLEMLLAVLGFVSIVNELLAIPNAGPALVGDPDMGFSGLRQFGPPLVHHMQLKIRSDTSAPNFMMVDSPGMIDSPLARRSDFDKSSVSP